MPENKPSQLGLIIKNIRKSKNMTQSKLSEKTVSVKILFQIMKTVDVQ